MDDEFKVDNEYWYNVPEISEILGLSQERIRELIRKGVIVGVKLGGWMVKGNNLAQFLRDRSSAKQD